MVVRRASMRGVAAYRAAAGSASRARSGRRYPGRIDSSLTMEAAQADDTGWRLGIGYNPGSSGGNHGEGAPLGCGTGKIIGLSGISLIHHRARSRCDGAATGGSRADA